MGYETIPEYLSALFEPLKYWMLAYDASAGGEKRSALSGLLEAEECGDYWGKLRICEERRARGLKESGEDPFERVCAAFAQNPFERFATLLSLACEMDARFSAALRLLGGTGPTLGLALRLFSKNPQESYGWRCALIGMERRLELLFREKVEAEGSQLRLRGCVLRYILGLDFGVEGLETHYPGMAVRADLSGQNVYEAIIKQGLHQGIVTVLCGQKGAGKKHQLRLLSKAVGVPLLFAEKKTAMSKDIFAALLISGGYLCICDVEEGDKIEEILKQSAGYTGSIFLTTEAETLNIPEGFVRSELHLTLPSASLRRRAWDYLLSEDGLTTDASEVSAKYAFTIGRIELSLVSALLEMRRQGRDTLTPELLEKGCRAQLPQSVSTLVKPVPAVFTWDDLVLPIAQKRTLADACDRVRFQALVYEDWGYGHVLPYGRGVRLLLTGPPGTGKTMAAQIIANELKMQLYKVNLSTLVSKYIGETEKNLASVFDGARRSGGILFFDEADALFGKRGEQKDSHDRYANTQTAYLLQAVEDYEGVLILATNLVQNFDLAFMRRIHSRVDFAMPSVEDRLKIWRSLAEGGAPLSGDIDFAFLAESFELTGAEIKNITLTAAFLAAGRGGYLGMRELVDALLSEYAKSGRIISKQELGEYADLIQD